MLSSVSRPEFESRPQIRKYRTNDEWVEVIFLTKWRLKLIRNSVDLLHCILEQKNKRKVWAKFSRSFSLLCLVATNPLSHFVPKVFNALSCSFYLNIWYKTSWFAFQIELPTESILKELNKKADTGPLSSLSVCAFSSSFIMFYYHHLSCQILMLFLLLTLWNFETV
jgi:hypothetical protein